MEKVVVGLSGGIDSSVALWLLKKQGHSPIGLTLRLPVWEGDRSLMRENICCTVVGIRWVKKLCLKLGVPHYVLDCRQEFKKKVVDYFVAEYRKGRTPNPCMICNQELRFPKFFQFAKKMGAHFVATGHYARIISFPRCAAGAIPPRRCLMRPKDKSKDQTYFLALLGQKELSHLLFPLGDYLKKEVYQIAKKQGFDVPVQRPESQDFCFVSGKSKDFFLKGKIFPKPGPIMDVKGNQLGKHRGLTFYTIGQRKGIELPAGPFYVLGFDNKKNGLIVTKKKKDLYQRKVVLSAWNFIAGETPQKAIKVKAKTRYQQPLASATLYPPKKGALELVFDRPQFAITPGQFAVFYLPAEASAKAGDAEVCLGAGMIAS